MSAPKIGTRVTCEDLATGETESRVIADDYVLVTDGRMEVTAVQVYGNGTVQITLKRASGGSVSEGTPAAETETC